MPPAPPETETLAANSAGPEQKTGDQRKPALRSLRSSNRASAGPASAMPCKAAPQAILQKSDSSELRQASSASCIAVPIYAHPIPMPHQCQYRIAGVQHCIAVPIYAHPIQCHQCQYRIARPQGGRRPKRRWRYVKAVCKNSARSERVPPCHYILRGASEHWGGGARRRGGARVAGQRDATRSQGHNTLRQDAPERVGQAGGNPVELGLRYLLPFPH